MLKCHHCYVTKFRINVYVYFTNFNQCKKRIIYNKQKLSIKLLILLSYMTTHTRKIQSNLWQGGQVSGPEQRHKKTVIIFDLHSFSATIFGSSPWQRYSSHSDADPQSFLSRKMSSVKVEPGAPMNTLDMAHIVLSNIASTFSVKIFIMNITEIN